MVDRVLKIDGNKIIGVKNVTINEPYFQGHFPGHPIMPGVLQLEAMAQVAGHSACCSRRRTAGQMAYFMSAEDVKWRKPVVPGDVLIIEVELTKIARKNRQGQGRLQGGRRNCERGGGHLHVARRLNRYRYRNSMIHPTAIIHPKAQDRRRVARSALIASSANTSRWATNANCIRTSSLTATRSWARRMKFFPSPASD